MLSAIRSKKPNQFSEAAEREYYKGSKHDPSAVGYEHLDRYVAGSFGADFFAGKRVLDVGCGEGVYSAWIADRGRAASVTGVELTGHRIRWDYQKSIQNLRFHEANFLLGSDAVGDEPFDIVFMNLVLHHLRFALDDALKRCFDSLKYGGELAAIEPNFFNPAALANHYVASHGSANEGFLSPQQMRAALLRAGFRSVQFGYFWRDRSWAKHALLGSSVWIRAIK